MKNEVRYEWDYETVEDGDIIEHNHSEKLSWFKESDKTDTLVLVVDIGNERDGLTERYWAYVYDGKLPEYFTDSYNEPIRKVPQKYHNELRKYIQQ